MAFPRRESAECELRTRLPARGAGFQFIGKVVYLECETVDVIVERNLRHRNSSSPEK